MRHLQTVLQVIGKDGVDIPTHKSHQASIGKVYGLVICEWRVRGPYEDLANPKTENACLSAKLCFTCGPCDKGRGYGPDAT